MKIFGSHRFVIFGKFLDLSEASCNNNESLFFNGCYQSTLDKGEENGGKFRFFGQTRRLFV